MKKQAGLSTRLKKAVHRGRDEGLMMVLHLILKEALSWVGVLFYPFYYFKEVSPSDLASRIAAIPADYEFSFFGPQELQFISEHPERKGYVKEEYVHENLQAGDTCLGCRYKGEIAGFTWFSLAENRHWYYRSLMKANEAYLYDIFIFKAFRGQNLSLILRLKNYEILSKMGRDTFYSITDYSNTPSFRFKKKLGAQIVFKGWHLECFDRWRKTFIIKTYPH